MVGDPVEMTHSYYKQGADEILYMDVLQVYMNEIIYLKLWRRCQKNYSFHYSWWRSKNC